MYECSDMHVKIDIHDWKVDIVLTQLDDGSKESCSHENLQLGQTKNVFFALYSFDRL